ncbi:hypothetical protein [Sphingomonas oryzagri]
MFTFVGDHYLALVCGSFGLFGVTLAWQSLRYAMTAEQADRP